jgi:hypothetical protein
MWTAGIKKIVSPSWLARVCDSMRHLGPLAMFDCRAGSQIADPRSSCVAVTAIDDEALRLLELNQSTCSLIISTKVVVLCWSK